MPNEFDAALSTFRPDPEALKSARLRQRKSDRELIQEGYEEQARLNEEQAREQERAAEEQAREQERRQKEQAKLEEQRRKEQIAAQNDANEPIYRQQGRPTYTDSEGRIKPVDDDATWQAKQEEKRLEQEQKAQARADAAFRKSEAVRLNQAEDKLESGLDTYKQAGSIASQAVQAKAGEISTLTAQAKALEDSAVTEQDLARLDAIRQRLEAARNEKAQLEDNERTLNIAKTNREIELAPERRALQQQRTALPIATAPKLDGVRQASVDVPNPSPTPASQDPARTAAVLRDHITILREKGDFARAEALEKRLTNPEAWNAEQAAFRAKATPEALVQSIEEQAPQITERHAAIRQQYAGLKQQQQSYVDRLTAAEQENQRLLSGSYSDADTVTVTDQNTGETSVWHKTALQAYHQAATGLRQWEQANRGQIDLLDIEQQQLAVDAVNLEKHQRALAAKQREAQRDQDARQTQALNRLRQEPGMAAFADEIEQETASARQRSADIVRKYADPKLREIALGALNDDMQRSQADRAQRMEAKRAEAARLYDWGKKLNVSDWLNEKDVSARLRQEAEKRGLTEQEGRVLLDTARKLDWSRPMTGPAAQGDLRGGKMTDPAAEPVRVLHDGRLIVHPALQLDPKAYTKAVQESPASAEAKKAALAQRRELAAPRAAQMLLDLQKVPEFAEYLAKNTSGTPVERMEQFQTDMREGGALAATIQRFQGGTAGLASTALGAAAAITGSDYLRSEAERFQERAQAFETAGSTSAEGTNAAFDFGSKVAGALPSVLGSLVPGGVLARLGQVAKLGSVAINRLALTGASVGSGAQSFGGTYLDAVQAFEKKGLSPTEAHGKAMSSALLSGAVTTALTAVSGLKGAEALLAQKEVVKKALADRARQIGIGIADEALEEGTDQIIQGIIAQQTYNPEKPLGAILSESLEAALIGGVLGGGMTALAEGADALAQRETLLAEDVAAAETEIEAFQDNRYDSSVNDQIRSRASLALAISRGLDLNAVDESILNAAGWTRKDASGLTRADGTLSKLKDYQGPAVLEVDTKGRVKLDSKYAANLKEHMPTLAGLISKRVLDWHTPGKIEEAAPASANSPTAQAPASKPAASSGEVSAAPQAAPPKPRGSSAQGAAPAAASAGGKTEAAAPAVSGAAAATTSTSPSLPVSQSPDSKEAVAALLPSYTDPADPRPQRAWEIANHLEMAGMPRADANKVAANAIRFQGIVGKTVNEHVTSEAFEKFLDEQGVTGDRSTREGTEPLRLASQPASSQTPASPAPASQEPKSPKPASTKPAKPEPKNGRPEYPALRQQLAAREMSTIEALREVVRLSGEHDTGVLQDILTDHLGLKKPAAAAAVETLRAQGELTGAPNEDISLASSKRRGSGKRFQPSDDFAPADSRDLGRSTAFARHRLAALASLPPRARRWGYRYISSLEPMLAQNAAIFEAVQIGPMARRNLGGQQIAVMNQGGKITLLIDLPAMMRNVSDLGDPRRRAAATLDEETWHAAQLHLEKSQPAKWNRDTLAQQWQDLPEAIKEKVWQAYHNAGNRPLPDTFSTDEAYAMQSEFLRMLGQGLIDPAAITESVDPASGLIQSLRDLLADLYNVLRKLIAGLPPSQAQTLDQQVQELQTVRARLLQPGPPSPSAFQRLQILRDPVAVGQMALQNGLIWQDLPQRDSLFSPEGLARVWDLLTPAFQRQSARLDPALAQAKTPQARTKRLLEILLDPDHARSLAQTLLQPGAAQQTSTSVLRRILGSLATYFRNPPKTTFDSALKGLDAHSALVLAHLRSLLAQARSEFEAAAGVQTVTSTALQEAITTASIAGVNTQDQDEVRANLRRTAQQSAEAMQAAWAQEAQQRAFFDAAAAVAEQMMPGVSDALQQRALVRQLTGQSWEALKARMEANLAQIGTPAASTQPGRATAPLALPSPAMRSAQAIQELLTDRDNLAQQNTSPAAREEIARRLLQEEWSAAILQVAAQAERRYYANAGELSPADQRQIEALLQVVRGDLTLGWQADRRQMGTNPESGAPIRMMGLARENALNALGITIEPDGTAWADAKAPIYIERGQILIKQSTLDDLATRLPITRRQFRRSELEQRAEANLTGAPSPVTADSIAEANAERAQAITERRQAARLDALEQADRQEISEDEAESGPLVDPIADPQTGRLSPGERGDLISWLATEGSLGWPDASQGGEWDWLKPYLDEYYTFESSRTRTKILKDKQGNSIGAVEQAVTGTKLGITNSHKNAARQGRLTHPGAVVEWLIQQGVITPAVETRETRDLSPYEGIREGTGLDAVQDAAEAAGYDVIDGIGNAVLAALEARKAARRDRKADPQTALELQTLRFERDTRSGTVAVEAHQLAALAEEGPTYVTARSPDADLTELSVLGSEWQPMDPDSREIEDYLEGHPAFRGLAEGQPERLMITLSGGTLYGRQTVPGEAILRVHDTGNTGIGLDLSDTGDFLDGAEPTEEPMHSPEADLEVEIENDLEAEPTLEDIDPDILAEAQAITLPDDPETQAAITAAYAALEANLQNGPRLASSDRLSTEEKQRVIASIYAHNETEGSGTRISTDYQGGNAWLTPDNRYFHAEQHWFMLPDSADYTKAMQAGFVRVSLERGADKILWAEFYPPLSTKKIERLRTEALMKGAELQLDPDRTQTLAAANRLSDRRPTQVEPGFYSTLAEVIRAKMPNRADARTLRGLVENPQTRIKAEELKWSGLLPWADSQPQPLTKQQVLDFLDTEGRVKFTVTRLQPIGPQQKAEQSLIWDRQLEITDQIADLRQRREEYGLTPSEAFRERLRLSAELSALDDQLNNLERQIAKGLPRNTQWTLPGGTNPQEVVVTWKQPRTENREPTTPNTNSDRTHYGDLDALAWYRTNDHTDANGQPGLFVEEFQSKWHQRGREEGYRGERQFTVEPDPAMPGQMWLVKDPQGNTVNFGVTEAEAQRWADAYAKESGAIPDAPYRKDWPLMLFKRALADAVAAGKAWIGWTSGDTQADRYDLSKRVSVIQTVRYGQTANLVVRDLNDRVILSENDVPLAKVPELVGKDIARQITEQPENTRQEYRGENLRVGGQGMRKFYDDMLVKEFGKYVKQWGGKVQKTVLAIDNGPFDKHRQEDIWRIDITPAMRESVAAGQALFARNRLDPQMLGRTVQFANQLIENNLITDFGRYVKAVSDNASDEDWKRLRPYLAGVWDIAATLNGLPIPDRTKARQLIAAFSTLRPARQPTASSTPRPSQARPARSLPQPSAADLWKAGMDPEIIAQITGTRPPEPTQADNTAAAAAELASLAEKTAETDAPSIFALPAEPDAPAMPDSPEERMEAGWNAHPEDEQLPNAPLIAKGDLDAAKPVNIQGGKSSLLSRGIYNRAIAALARHSTAIGDMFFGTGTVTQYIHKAGLGKPGGHASEYSPWRASFLRQVTDPAKVGALAQGARAGIEELKRVQEAARTAVASATNLEQAMKGFAGFINSLDHSTLSPSVWNAIRQRALAGYHISLKDKNYTDKEFAIKARHFARVHGLKARVMIGMYQALPAGFDLAAYKTKVEAAIAWDKHLLATRDGQVAMFAPPQAEHPGPIPARDDPASTGLYIAAEMLSDNGISLDLATETKEIDVIGKNGKPQKKKVQILTDRLNEPFTGLFDDDRWWSSDRAENIEKLIRDYHQVFVGKTIHSANSWMLLPRLALENPGIGFVIDPPYFGVPETENGSVVIDANTGQPVRKGTSNYDSTTDIRTPDDLLRLFDSFVLPAWQSGAKFVLTNEWDDSAAVALRLRGATVVKIARQGRKGDTPELVAYNFNPNTGELRPRRISAVTPGQAFSALQRGAYPGASHSGNLDPRLKLAARTAAQAEPEAARVALQQRQDAAQLSRGNPAGRSDRPVGADQRPAPRAPTVERTMAPLPPGADATPLERAQWDREQARLKADLRDAGDSNAQLDVLYDNLDTPSQFRPMPWDEARDLLLSLRPGDRMIDPTGTRSRPVVKIEPIMQTKNGGTMYGIWLEGATQPTRLREYIRMMSEGELAIERQQDIARKEASDRILAQLMGEGIELTAEQVRQADILKASLRQTFPNVPPPTTQEIRQILAAAPRFQVSPSPRLQVSTTPSQALVIYRRLTAERDRLAQEGRNLTPDQAQRLEQAERQLGQVMMDFLPPPTTPALRLESEPTRTRDLNRTPTAEQLRLFASDRAHSVAPALDLRYTIADGQDPQTTRPTRDESNPLDPRADARSGTAQRFPSSAQDMLPWARAQGWLIDTDDLVERLRLTKETYGGDEHDVWEDELTQRAVKITKDLNGIPAFVAGSPAAYLENLRRQNALFGTGFAFEGIVDDNGTPRFVISQPWIIGTAAPQQAKEDYFRALGFDPVSQDSFYSSGRDLLITDARAANVFQHPDGSIQPIDLQTKVVSPRQAEMYENRAAAYNKGLASAPRTPAQTIEVTGLAPAISVRGTAYTGSPGLFHGGILTDYVWRKVFTPQQRRDDPDKKQASKFAHEEWMDSRGSGFDDFGFLDTRSGKFLTREEAYALLTERGFATPPESWSTRNKSLDSSDLFWSQPTTTSLPASERLAQAAQKTNTTPTEAQKQAENYQTGKVSVHGLRLSIENPRGSVRRGTDANGKAWEITMPHDYGRILGTHGADKDHVDFFMGPDPDSPTAFVINQRKPGNGHFDEHKVMLGFTSAGLAARGYLDSYTKGWTGYQSIVPMTLDQLKHWLEHGKMDQPVTQTPVVSKDASLQTSQSPRSVSPSAPALPASPRQIADTVAQASFNHLDRKLTLALRRMGQKAISPEPVQNILQAIAAWKAKDTPSHNLVRSLADLAQRELIPETVLPREILSALRELQIATSIGQQKALDLSRAALGKVPKFSDLAFPAEYVQNPEWREKMFSAMEQGTTDTLPEPLQKMAGQLRALLVEAGREAVAQGRMSPDTFEGLRTTYMPRFTKEEAEAGAGDWTKRFKLGIKDILAQRSTAFHIVDTTRKGKDGLPLLINHHGRKWRFADAQARDAYYEELIQRETLEPDLGNTDWSWMTRRDSRLLHTVTPEMLQAPATMTADQRAIVARVQRQLRQQFKKEDPYEPKDLIKDPVYAVMRYLAQMTHDNATAKFFNLIEKNPDWTTTTDTAGFTQIPDSTRFGTLAGKWVRSDIAQQVVELADSVHQALQLWDATIRLWKAGKTVLNPATHGRNVFGNIPFAIFAGNNPLNPGNWPTYIKAFRILREGGAEYRQLYESGVLGADYAGAELKSALQTIIPGGEDLPKSSNPVLAQIQAITKRAADWAAAHSWKNLGAMAAAGAVVGGITSGPIGAVYGATVGAGANQIYRGLTFAYRFEDDIFKAAAFIKARMMGMTIEQAAEHVRHWFPYYDKPTSFTLRQLGRTGLPFISFARESARIGMNALRERPLALATTLAIPTVISAISQSIMGLSDDDMEDIRQTQRGKGAKLLGMTPLAGVPLFSMVIPVRTASGSLQQIDLSSTHPFADWLADRVENFNNQPWWQSWARSAFANPMLAIGYTVATGKDAFNDRVVFDGSYTDTEQWKNLLTHAYTTAVPPLAPGGSNYIMIEQATRRSSNKTMSLRSPAQAVARGVFGVDIRTADPDIYRLADQFRQQRGLPAAEKGVAYPTDAPGRARKALFEELIQDKPSVEQVARHLQTLNDLGSPVRTVSDVIDILDRRRPDGIINPKALRGPFRASLNPEARRVLDQALAAFQRARANTPGAFSAARQKINATTRRRETAED